MSRFRFHSRPHIRRIALTLGLGLVAGAVFDGAGSPLPWMIGPLLTVAALNVAGNHGLGLPTALRCAGQWAIGSAVGLYFSSAVFQQVLGLWPWLIATAIFGLAIGAAGGNLLSKLTGVDRATGYFSMAIGGAVEMTNQAERSGARVDRVAAAQSLRVMLIVVGLPYLFFLSGAHGSDPYEAITREVDPGRLGLLVAVTIPAAGLLQRLGLPNAWTLGPLTVTATLTASGVTLSALPHTAVAGGQLLLGCALAGRFGPDFIHSAPRFMGSVALVSLLVAAGCAAFAGLIAAATGLPWATMILATAPGGVAEMSLTAKLLHLGVPVVAAFQVLRLLMMVLAAGPAFRLWQRANRNR